MKSFSESYKAAGVDITAGYAAVELMKQHVARTMTPGAIGGLGGFGGLFELDMTGLTHPVLVSGTDGVGTKLKIAFLMDKHDTVGIDCVAMCVNDVITCGAKPLVFLDYIACGKNYPEKIASIVAGLAEGCVQAGAALVGGETAEMPGFYPEQEYDLAGFTVGVVEKSKIIDNTKMQAGRRHRAALQRRALQRLFSCAQDIQCGVRGYLAALRRAFRHAGRNAAHAHKNLRQARAGADGAGGCARREPHHGRRLL